MCGTSKFVNLHVHSCYSLLDGMSKVEDIVAKVKKMGQHAFAITEHGNVFSAVKAYKLAKQYSLKHIYGIEFYITKNRFEKDAKNKYNHLTVLAKNEKGRININKLASLGYIEGFYSKPRIDHELLKQHKEGLIVLSGCMASEFQQALAGGKIGDDDVIITEQNIQKAKEVALFYRNIFGEDYYLEIQSHSDHRQQKLNRVIVDIAKELNIPYVVTADSHFLNEDDFELHGVFIQIGQNREAGETYLDGQLQSEEEARRLLKPALTDEEIDEAIINTMIIADKCNVHVPLSPPIIPHVSVPSQFKNEAEYLKYLCEQGWKRRGISKKENVEEYKKRLKYEYDAIVKMGFEGYYLLVESYANTVKRRGIARGSGGGSLVAYLLNIVDIDPVKYGLYFERFIDVGALSLLEEGKITKKELKIPDFDLDFGRLDREVVIESIINRYGEDRFVALGQFQYIWDKTAIKDIGRVLGIPFEVTNEITKTLGDDSLQEAIESGKLTKYVDKYPKLFDYAQKISGLPRSFGVHPCGKAVTIDEPTYYTALAKNDDTIVLQGDMKDAEDLGIVKIDTLGLRTIDVIYDTLELISKDYDYINPQNMNFEDEKVLKVFKEGRTEGIFQFESEGMKSTLRKINPTCLDDLGVANALYRPGSMKFIDEYVKRKNGEVPVQYLHKDLESILNITYGILVYQEQLIEIGRLAKMRNPDLLRKATGKKDAKLLQQVKPELQEGLKCRGWTDEQIEELWNIMLDFAKYSFNKSHAYAYAMIAYITAFLKTYHPTEFICSLLNSYIGDNRQDKFDQIKKIIDEAKLLNISIEMPNLKNINYKCHIENGKIIYGISLIKHLNSKVADELKEVGSKQFDNFVDVLCYIEEHCAINKTQMDVLIKLGFFSKYGDIEKLNSIYGKFKERYKKSHKDKTKEARIKEIKEYAASLENKKMDVQNQILYEKDVLGFCQTTFPNVNKAYGMILEVNTKYSPKITLYIMNNGSEVSLKVSKQHFYNNNGEPLLNVGDIIKVLKVEQKPKLTKVNGKWVETDIKENWLVAWQMSKKYEK